jgi:NAD kinase
MTNSIPRVVIVTRDTEYEMLLAKHATRGQAKFFLQERGQSINEIEQRHIRFGSALHKMISAIPTDWRRNHVKRHDLDRFLFEPEDLIIALGQDGLVANTAKYLNGQSVIGVNPDQHLFDGVLVPFSSEEASRIIVPAMYGDIDIQQRTMAQVKLDDGQSLYALNELFIGHRSHQSARYIISAEGREEHHSSSGVIVATGTGATGWARSIHQERHDKLKLPKPEDDVLAFYVREAFPSVSTCTKLTSGLINSESVLEIRSENNEGGVIFGDGIEADYLPFNWGMRAEFKIATNKLSMIRPIGSNNTQELSLIA